MGPFREAYQFSEGIAAVLALDKKGYGPFGALLAGPAPGLPNRIIKK